MTADIKLWRRAKPRTRKDSLITPCDEASLTLERPLLLCLGGFESAEEKLAAGFVRSAETMLGGADIHDSGIDLLTVSYVTDNVGRLAKTSENALKHLTDLDPRAIRMLRHTRQYAGQLTERLFKKHLPDLRAVEGETRETLLAQATENFGKITIFAYSLGTLIASQLHDCLTKEMKKSGYSSEERRRVLSRTHVVSFGEIGIWLPASGTALKSHLTERKPWNFSSIHFISTNDDRARALSGITSAMLGESRDRIVTLGQDENMLLFLSPLPTTLQEVRSRKSADTEMPVPDITDLELRGGRHGAQLYMGRVSKEVYFSKEGGQWFLPSVLACALRNGVNGALDGTRGGALGLLHPAPKPGAADASAGISRSSFDFNLAEHDPAAYRERIEALLQSRLHLQKPPLLRSGWRHALNNGQPALSVQR